jgi:hypothetical protein
MGHFNMLPHVWQLLAKHMFNIERKDPSSSKESALIPCEKFKGLLTLSKDALREEGCL